MGCGSAWPTLFLETLHETPVRKLLASGLQASPESRRVALGMIQTAVKHSTAWPSAVAAQLVVIKQLITTCRLEELPDDAGLEILLALPAHGRDACLHASLVRYVDGELLWRLKMAEDPRLTLSLLRRSSFAQSSTFREWLEPEPYIPSPSPPDDLLR